MTDNVKEIDKYISQVKKHLICYKKEKKQILSELKSEITSYAEEKGKVDFSIICKQFGKPEELAQTYLFDSDVKKIKRAMNIRKVIITAVIVALMMFAVSLIIALIDNQKTNEVIIYEILEEGTTVATANINMVLI